MIYTTESTEVRDHSADLPSKLYVIFDGLKINNLSLQIYIIMNDFLQGFD